MYRTLILALFLHLTLCQTASMSVPNEKLEYGEPLGELDIQMAEELIKKDESKRTFYGLLFGNEGLDGSLEHNVLKDVLESGNNYEGDIILDIPPEIANNPNIQHSAILINSTRKWQRKGSYVGIPYKLSSLFGKSGSKERATIVRAMTEFEKHTCIRFTPHNNEDNFVSIESDPEKPGLCNSNVGRSVYWGNKIHLGTHCLGSVGVVMHELMHTIGYWHEQSRPDRDDYIKIHWENIVDEDKDQFRKCSENDQKCDTQRIPYDTESIMHYPETIFSKNGERTMTVIKDPSLQLGLGQITGRLSAYDIQGINDLYCSKEVDCGNGKHVASCDACEQPGIDHSVWCGGNCEWSEGWFWDACDLKEIDLQTVYCGHESDKRVSSCGKCKGEHDPIEYCGGDCEWLDGWFWDSCSLAAVKSQSGSR